MALDYTALILAVNARVGDTSWNERSAEIISLAEASIYNVLNVSEMDTSATVTTDTSGQSSLPDDCLNVIHVVCNAITINQVAWDVLFARERDGYVVRGKTLYSTYNDADHEVLYKARAPELTSANTTNWLLEKYPEIYIYALACQVLRSNLDADSLAKANISQQLFNDAVQTANSNSLAASFSNSKKHILDTL